MKNSQQLEFDFQLPNPNPKILRNNNISGLIKAIDSILEKHHDIPVNLPDSVKEMFMYGEDGEDDFMGSEYGEEW